ncbi:hypothetical protein PISMIDRAFT_337444 [Pisolithus microcarpus 441]|uniref:Uncharacterized protein n=1 Tax=Pisolithus microcarpus 441 TaxID=765257 RepID=A0A0C9YMC7_9AGAM|nr:hypothetical protein PISMIDRAFT_337444 [Pisolithus microcarpus 441]
MMGYENGGDTNWALYPQPPYLQNEVVTKFESQLKYWRRRHSCPPMLKTRLGAIQAGPLSYSQHLFHHRVCISLP